MNGFSLPLVEVDQEPPLRAERCSTCKFFEATEDEATGGDAPDGICHRHPPVLNPVATYFAARERIERDRFDGRPDDSYAHADSEVGNTYCWYMPHVSGTNFCGEWQPALARAGENPGPHPATIREMRKPLVGVRVLNAARRAGVNTLHDLSQKTAGELLEQRGMGKRGLDEVRRLLATFGLALKGEKVTTAPAGAS